MKIKTCALALSTLLLTSLPVVAQSSGPFPVEGRQTLYKTPGAQGAPYRIPAIVTAPNGDIFALSDFRPCGADIGYGEVDIMCRISKDNGATWGEEFCIADGTGDDRSDVWRVGFGDAAVVADAERNELLVMMVCGKTVCWNGNYLPGDPKSNPNRVARVRAKWNRKTGEWEWTKPEEVTESVYSIFVDESGKPTVQSLFIGSGRIFQSRKVKVDDYYRLYCSVWTKNGGNRVIYSDDFGESWKVLGALTDRPAPNGDEPKCEELPDGSVILSSRSGFDGRVFNIFTFTDIKKGTGTWGKQAVSNEKNRGVVSQKNATNGEIMLVEALRKSDGERVCLALQSVPFGPGRSHVGVYYKEMTPDLYADTEALAADWTRGLQISDRGSAYSTMTWQKDRRFGFFYEEEPGGYQMVYLPLTIEQLTDGNYLTPPVKRRWWKRSR